MSESTGKRLNSSDDDDSGDDQARLLQLLNAQCAASLGGFVPVASTSKLEEEADDDDDDDEYSSEGDDDDSDREDQEWSGIGDSDEAPTANSRQPVIVSFEDSVRNGKRKLDESEVATFAQKDTFMSTKIRRANADTANEQSRRKGKSKADQDDEHEEKHLKELDASLYSLIQDLPSNATASSNSMLLDKLSALPSPRLTTRKSQENEKAIDKHAPRTLHEKIYTARLKRAKIADAEARENGVVIAAGKGKYALTKKARREQTGAEDARRKKARGISGVVGKMRKGGAVLTLNKDEIRKGNEGDFGGISKRKSKGVPKQHRR